MYKVSKELNGIIFGINKSYSAKNAGEWQFSVKSDREVTKIIREFNVDEVDFTSPNEAFNYLKIFLDRLPVPLIPEFLFFDMVDGVVFSGMLYFVRLSLVTLQAERNGIPDLNLLPPLQLDLLASVVELLRSINKSAITETNIWLFRRAIGRSLN
jgi:hypothetical protein